MRSNSRRTASIALLTALLLGQASFTALAADEEGYDGLTVSVKTEGFLLNPTLTRVTVAKVDPNSPASSAGIAVGDEITEVEGIKVAGTKASVLKPHLSKRPGEATTFTLVRASGAPFSVRMVAVQQPKR